MSRAAFFHEGRVGCIAYDVCVRFVVYSGSADRLSALYTRPTPDAVALGKCGQYTLLAIWPTHNHLATVVNGCPGHSTDYGIDSAFIPEYHRLRLLHQTSLSHMGYPSVHRDQ